MSKTEIAARLQASRKAAGYKTAFAFCDAFNIPKSTYSQHESGIRTPKTAALKLYADSLGVDPNWLKTGEGDPLKASNPNLKAKLQKNMETATQQNELVENILNRRHEIISVDEALLAELLEELLERAKMYDLDANQLAHAATGLYTSLRQTSIDPASRKKMVQVAINTYFQFKN